MMRHFLPLAFLALVLAALGTLAPRGAKKPDPAEREGATARLAGGRGGQPAQIQTETERLLAQTPRQGPHPGKRAHPRTIVVSGHLLTAQESRVWVAPGLAIRSAPRAGAKVLGTVRTIEKVPFARRRGDHFEVRYGEVEGWVHLPGYDRPDVVSPPLGNTPEPPLPLPAREPDAALLARARSLLGQPERRARLGPYELYTDVVDATLEAQLAAAASETGRRYEERYGRQAVGEAKGAVVLFASEGAYRNFQLGSPGLAGVAAAGHNDLGVVALYVGDRHREEVASTLVHELAHLLNRRALGPALPAWLDEGLCEDLAFAKIGEDGRLFPGEIGGRAVRTGAAIDFTGPLTAFHRLRGELLERRLPQFAQLAAPDWPGFRHAGGLTKERRASYDLAGAFVRYLVEGENGRRSPGLQAFLAGVARGESPEAPALFAALGEDPELVEAGFRAWLVATAHRLLGPP